MPPRSVEARCGCRVDLAGGTLDIWPLGLLHPGARTVNVAVDVVVRVALTRRPRGYRVRQSGEAVEGSSAEELAARPEAALLGLVAVERDWPPVEIVVDSGSPRGGGLGASSAVAVAAVAAGEALLERPEPQPSWIGAVARDLEARLMGLPTGRQDHFAALLGGVLEIRHRPGGEEVRRLDVDLERLGASLVVAYSGRSHFSAGNNWKVVRARLDGEPDVVEAFDGIARAAREIPQALESGALAAVGELMSAEWSCRRRLAPEVSSERVESLLAAGSAAGAWGGKVCGAGGGGCVVLLAPAARCGAVRDALTDAGGEALAAPPRAEPLRVRKLE